MMMFSIYNSIISDPENVKEKKEFLPKRKRQGPRIDPVEGVRLSGGFVVVCLTGL